MVNGSKQEKKNGVVTTYNYNKLNRLTDMAVAKGAASVASFNYNPNETGRTLDAVGNRRAARETINVATSTTIQRNINYDYDKLYRLTKESIGLAGGNNVSGLGAGDIVYDAMPGYNSTETTAGLGFDPVGNARSRTLQSANTPLQNKVSSFSGRAFDRNDQIDTDSNPATASANYDDNGNTLVGEVESGAVAPSSSHPDEYDFEDHLVKRSNGTGTGNTTVTLVYDGDGNRVRKKVEVVGSDTIQIDYVLDEEGPSGYAQVLEEYKKVGNGVSSLDCSYVHGHDLISQRQGNGTRHYYGYDGHNNVRFLTDGNPKQSDGVTDNPNYGKVTDAYNYEAFGILVDEWHAGTATPNNYLYCGEQYDPHLGQYYLRARYFNPRLGRFWTRDTFEGRRGEPVSLHKYLYCRSNPVLCEDPRGLNETGTLGGSLGWMGADAFVEGITLPAINGARLWAITKIAAAAIAVTLTVTSDENVNKPDIVFRRLSPIQAATPWMEVGIYAADPSGVTSITDHVLGRPEDLDSSPWISTTRFLSVARDVYKSELFPTPIVEIDLKKVSSLIVDLMIPSNLAKLQDGLAESLAAQAGEVLIFGYVPPRAILGEVK